MAKRFAPRRQAFLLTSFKHCLVRLIEIHQHDDTNLYGDTGQCNESNAHRNREVITQQIHQPNSPDHCERERAHDDAHFRKVSEVQKQQDDDNRQC